MANKKTWGFCSALVFVLASGPAMAGYEETQEELSRVQGFIEHAIQSVANNGAGNQASGNSECPVDLVKGKTLDEEFGYSADGQTSASDITRCLEQRHEVKLLIQANKFCRDSVPNGDCTRPYALGNITNVINDYEITNGMKRGEDYQIAVIVHSGGGYLLLDRDSNQFRGKVMQLMDQGVKFYFCQNTARGFMGRGVLTPGNATAELIPGVEYVTAGISALADFQSRGWTYVQP